MRCTSLRSVAIALLCLAGTGPMLGARLGAQSLDSLRVGARVSVASSRISCRWPWQSCEGRAAVLGVISHVSADTLVIQFGPSATVSVARNRDQEIYLSEGRSRARSAWRGAVLNGLSMYAITSLTDATPRSKVLWAWAMAASGSAIGALIPSERWKKLPTLESPH